MTPPSLGHLFTQIVQTPSGAKTNNVDAGAAAARPTSREPWGGGGRSPISNLQSPISKAASRFIVDAEVVNMVPFGWFCTSEHFRSRETFHSFSRLLLSSSKVMHVPAHLQQHEGEQALRLLSWWTSSGGNLCRNRSAVHTHGTVVLDERTRVHGTLFLYLTLISL